MENRIHPENLIWLSLVYNYLANQSVNLTFEEVNNYMEHIKQELREIYSKWSISEEDPEDFIWNLYYYGIEKDDNHNQYILIDLEDLEWRYRKQPDDIIKVSLYNDALSTIHVDKNNLQIQTEYEQTSDAKNIYAISQQSAIEDVRKILESEKCKNIQIYSASLKFNLGDEPTWHISYSCEKPVEKVKLLIKN